MGRSSRIADHRGKRGQKYIKITLDIVMTISYDDSREIKKREKSENPNQALGG
jgi:hypothetical protein